MVLSDHRLIHHAANPMNAAAAINAATNRLLTVRFPGCG